MAVFALLVCIRMICFPVPAQAAARDCPKECLNVEGRMEQQQCAINVLRAAEEELQKYLTMSKQVWKDEIPDFIRTIDLAQGRWIEFRKAACGAVSEKWTTGTGRSIATIACEIDLTRRWTHILWEYLSPEQNKGGLPEPKSAGE